MTDLKKKALDFHNQSEPGKIEVITSKPLKSKEDLALAYTPGVVHPCLEIRKNPEKAWEYTMKGNTIAIITDGSRILGLGNIGPLAGLPVMEGKAMLFKMLGDVNAVPVCISTQDSEEFIETVKRITTSFGGINLEDIKAPRCFKVERELSQALDIPVFHDDQHGTAVAALAGLINALKHVKKDISKARIVVNGAGAAGLAIARLLIVAGAKDLVILDSKGILGPQRKDLEHEKLELAKTTNKRGVTGGLADAVKGADAFIGVSAPGVLTKAMVRSMNSDAIVFALANPDPEITVKDALDAGARVVATGSSSDHNQVNNSLVFPGMFRGMLDCRAKKVNNEMKLAAAHAIAELVPKKELHGAYIIPDALDPRVAKHVALAVVKAAMKSGVARKEVKDLKHYEERVEKRIGHSHEQGKIGRKH